MGVTRFSLVYSPVRHKVYKRICKGRELMMKKTVVLVLAMLFCLFTDSISQAAKVEDDLASAWKIIQSKPFVDLTHPFEPGIPHWKGFPDEQRERLFSYAKDGFVAHLYTHAGQWGTHVDPPAHFAEGLRTIEQISPKEMILPLVVLDVHANVEKNADYTVTLQDVKNWEARHGKISSGAFVALRTDWSKRWPDAAAMANRDALGIDHYPGWSLDVLKYLYEDCKITASGHETTDTDPGIATSKDDYSLESYILHQNHFQIELLANLDKVPESGALVVVTFPNVKGGSGFPARVFAILP